MFQYKKYVFIILAVIVIGLIVIFFAQNLQKNNTSELFITANPFDLSQIKGFSKYRSCEGHDYRAPNIDGRVESTPRSMKHYVEVISEFRGTNGEVDIFAPFDGIISSIEDSQTWLSPNARNVNDWQFIFFHLELNTNLTEGSSVKAGQRIGTASLNRKVGGETDNFDIALKYTRTMGEPAVDAPFNHATQNVLDEYKKYKIDVTDFIISEQERDNNPCPLSPNKNGRDVNFVSGAGAKDYVWLVK